MNRRPMQRRERELSAEQAWQLLTDGEYGVLATCGQDGWPYAVPVSYAVLDGGVYVHGATDGHKVRNLADNDRVSLAVVTRQRALPADLSVDYLSVVAFARARPVTGHERGQALLALGRKYAAGHAEEVKDCIARTAARTLVLRLDVAVITGKRGGQPQRGGNGDE